MMLEMPSSVREIRLITVGGTVDAIVDFGHDTARFWVGDDLSLTLASSCCGAEPSSYFNGSPKNGDLRRRCCKCDEPVPYTEAYETDLRNPIKSLRKLERALTVHVDPLDAWTLSHILPGEISELYREHFAEFINTVLRKARTPQEEKDAIKILDSMADVVVRYSHGRN